MQSANAINKSDIDQFYASQQALVAQIEKQNLQIVDVLTQVQTTTTEIQRSKEYGKKKLQKANAAATGKDGGAHGDFGPMSDDDFSGDDEDYARQLQYEGDF